MSFSIRKYQLGDEEEIVKFLNKVFNSWPDFEIRCSPLDHWKWKFIDNPLKLTVVWLAIGNGQIIGCVHALPQKLKIGDKLLQSLQGVDVATHPNYRGMGVYNKLREYRFEQIRDTASNFYFSVSSNPILQKKNLKEHLPPLPFTLENLIRIYDIDLHLKMVHSEKAFVKKYGFQVLKIINRLKASKAQIEQSGDFNITRIDRFNDEVDEFCFEINTHYGFIVQRDRDYLNWRYCDPRGGKYDVNVAIANGKISGYTVLGVNNYASDYPIGYIVDLIALPDRLDIVSELTKYAVEYFDKRGINEIRVNALKDSLAEAIFRDSGFFNYPAKPILFNQGEQRSDSLDNLSKQDTNKIHFSYGDYDWI